MNHPESLPTSETLRHYTYHDNRNGGEVVFECEADSILEADKLYQKKPVATQKNKITLVVLLRASNNFLHVYDH